RFHYQQKRSRDPNARRDCGNSRRYGSATRPTQRACQVEEDRCLRSHGPRSRPLLALSQSARAIRHSVKRRRRDSRYVHRPGQPAQEADITPKSEAVEDAVSGLQSEKVARFTYPQKPFLQKTVKSWLWLLLLEVLTLAQAVPPGKRAPPPLPNPTAQSAVIRGTVVNHTDGSTIACVRS